ncbi:ATP-binding protein [Streptomyces sp. NPDC088775]|uniref:ATP-binding protein n=1 Tax=Streptomyces sp. NPDC088775 TaxID=3365896 RepID=UPI00382E26A3
MQTDQHQADTGWVATSIFKRQPESVACARNWAMQVYSDAGGPLPDVCYLLVSEVATNAVLHGGGSEYRVTVRSDFSIEVWDASPVLPQRRQADDSSTDGRGLELLEALAPDYTVSAELGGKTVCFLPKGW